MKKQWNGNAIDLVANNVVIGVRMQHRRQDIRSGRPGEVGYLRNTNPTPLSFRCAIGMRLAGNVTNRCLE
jgi:hypothetical protein